mmetsp:Transcript_11877/g.24123  ORF Transcript_11877/g.24123 Transcript_11877/m.24123 type:complete len:205 (+) Transcript_11877:61-675(+)
MNMIKMNKESGVNDFLICTTTTGFVPNQVRSLEGRDDLNVLRDGDLTKNFSKQRSGKQPQALETIPLVILQETCHYCSRTIDIALVEGIPELKKRKHCSSTSEGCTFGEEGDMCTLCTQSSSLSSIEFDSRLSACWSGVDLLDDGEDLDDPYFAEESKSSLDYSSSRCDDATTMDESFRSFLDSRDESYFTEGFIEVGELPRVS